MTSSERALNETREWVRHAVIGLNLCPFAKAPFAKEQIRFVVSEATDTALLLNELRAEMERLALGDATVETTLLIHPQVLDDFGEYNAFLDEADAALEQLGFDGVLQVASFHPRYRFAGTAADDIGNATNRSPYPTLHLLREESIDRAVAAFPNAEAIYETNIRALEALGHDGWAEVQRRIVGDAVP